MLDVLGVEQLMECILVRLKSNDQEKKLSNYSLIDDAREVVRMRLMVLSMTNAVEINICVPLLKTAFNCIVPHRGVAMQSHSSSIFFAPNFTLLESSRLCRRISCTSAAYFRSR